MTAAANSRQMGKPAGKAAAIRALFIFDPKG
jgi:hypothetical protein